MLEAIYQILGAYFEDDCADELIYDPVLTAILDKKALASQPTLSRCFNHPKENITLRALASDIEDNLRETTVHDKVSYVVCYGEFLYQAETWKYPCRVIYKVEKPTDQFIHMYRFIVINVDSVPDDLIRFYYKRSSMENFIKERKNGFDFRAVSSCSKLVNANRLQIHALSYNIFS